MVAVLRTDCRGRLGAGQPLFTDGLDQVVAGRGADELDSRPRASVTRLRNGPGMGWERKTGTQGNSKAVGLSSWKEGEDGGQRAGALPWGYEGGAAGRDPGGDVE